VKESGYAHHPKIPSFCRSKDWRRRNSDGSERLSTIGQEKMAKIRWARGTGDTRDGF